MTSYQGPAVAIVGGDEIPVTADLALHADHPLKAWGGMLEADPSTDWADANPGTLRLPDGREGQFMAPPLAPGSGTFEIRGTGPAPFGDS
ncbi:hypothetical protein ACFWRZ_08315 [Streptomyces rubiginosohelvolus]|uniref:hypothetical protein n=1 Tax=Streptomyces rubiginosohelvolus TaxID=67362 RepID=UPI00366395FB